MRARAGWWAPAQATHQEPRRRGTKSHAGALLRAPLQVEHRRVGDLHGVVDGRGEDGDEVRGLVLGRADVAEEGVVREGDGDAQQPLISAPGLTIATRSAHA